MSLFINIITLSRSQLIPIYIPDASSVRVFRKVEGNNWDELDRIDLSDGHATNSYSYDAQIIAFLFHPALIGSTVQIQYEHNNIPNPGTLDLLPTILAEQTTHNYNKIVSGLFVARSYQGGTSTGWQGHNLVISGGLARLKGELYTVGDTYWDLNQFGAQAGEDIVTSTLFYLYDNELSEDQKRKHFIESSSHIRSGRYALKQGGGISSSLTEINTILAEKLHSEDITSFIEVMRLVVISKKAPDVPDVHFTYEPNYRFNNWI